MSAPTTHTTPDGSIFRISTIHPAIIFYKAYIISHSISHFQGMLYTSGEYLFQVFTGKM